MSRARISAGLKTRRKPRCVTRWGGPELTSVLPAELRSALVADSKSNTGRAARLGDQEIAPLQQANLLLILNRAHGRRCLEVTMKRSVAHMGELGQMPDLDRLMVMRPNPADRPANLAEAAIGASEQAELLALRALQQPKDDLPFEHGREHRNLNRPVEQPHHPAPRVEQVVIDGVGRKAVAADRRLVFDEERGDRLDVDGVADGQVGKLAVPVQSWRSLAGTHSADHELAGSIECWPASNLLTYAIAHCPLEASPAPVRLQQPESGSSPPASEKSS